MSTALIQSSNTTIAVAPSNTAYSFLSHPPPQKKRPTQPLPSPPHVPDSPSKPIIGRRRSATTSAITAWIATVQPGSPAPPTPQRRPSLSSPRRPSISPRSVSRRPSACSARAPSGSFLNILDTPTTASRITPSVKDFKHDLTAVGYASVFVHFPNTPSSTAYPTFPDRPSIVAVPEVPASEVAEKPARRGLKHFRSLAALTSTRARSKSTSTPTAMPSVALAKACAPPVPLTSQHMRVQSNESVSKNKKSKYAKYRPPPLASELALAQLADGGKMDDHIRRFAEAQARAGGATMVDGKLVGVGDVWRDGAGGVWRDQDEEWEYAHLLGGEQDYRRGNGDWVRFGSGSVPSATDCEERRESVSSQDSDLDPRYAMQTDADARDDLAVFGSAVMPSAMRKPGMSVLALPSRHRRAAPHLRKPEFLLDVFPVPESAPQSQPSSKARRRPAPLTLTPPSPASKRPMNPLDDTRKDFINNSFAPTPAPAPAVPVRAPASPHHRSRPAEQPLVPAIRVESRSAAARKIALGGKPSLGMRGLLKVMGGKKDI